MFYEFSASKHAYGILYKCIDMLVYEQANESALVVPALEWAVYYSHQTLSLETSERSCV